MAYPKIEGERPDLVYQKLRDKGETTPLEGIEDLEAFFNRPPEEAAPYSSIEAQLIDFLIPPIKDSSIFRESRAIELLKFLRDNLPQWSRSAEITDLVLSVINEEIDRYLDLRERRHSGIAG